MQKTVLILLLFISVMFILIAPVKGAGNGMQYPGACDTTEERKEYLTELDDNLMSWYNAQTRDMTRKQADAFFRNVFLPKSIELHRLLNNMADYRLDPGTGNLMKNVPAVPEVKKWNPNVNMLDYVELKRDSQVGMN